MAEFFVVNEDGAVPRGPGPKWGDAVFWSISDQLLEIRDALGIKICTRERNVVVVELSGPPPYSGDPRVYFSEMLAHGNIWLRLKYQVRETAQSILTELFDPVPDERFVHEFELSLCSQRSWFRMSVYGHHSPLTRWRYSGVKTYRRDIFAEIHAEVRSQSVTRQGLAISALRPSVGTAAYADLRGAVRSQISVECDYGYRFVKDGRCWIFIDGDYKAIGALDNAACRAIARATTCTYLRHYRCDPGRAYELSDEKTLITRSQNGAEFSWLHNHASLVDRCLALYPLALPDYILLWISQIEPQFVIQNELRMITLIRNVRQSCSAILQRRRMRERRRAFETKTK